MLPGSTQQLLSLMRPRPAAVPTALLFGGLAFLAPHVASAEQKGDVWEPFRYFLGSWQVASQGEPGVGTGALEFSFILEGKFLQVKNRTTYPPQQKNPKGEVHQDWGILSYDRQRQKVVWRQFNVEGFVNQYTMELPAPGAKTFIFVSEQIENIAPGWRARETYTITNPNECEAKFELAAPGKDFEVYSQSHLTRTR